MPAYKVFQISPFWYFSTKDMPQSQPYETRDAAEFFAQKAIVEARKAERKASKAAEKPAEG